METKKIVAVRCPVCGGEWGICSHSDTTDNSGTFLVPEEDYIYYMIVGLEGQRSMVPGRNESSVWVPAIANGGLKMLLRELQTRGWRIIPPKAD